ncbi:MAG: metallophosphoesterase [Halodesulfurarchaeum sp.]
MTTALLDVHRNVQGETRRNGSVIVVVSDTHRSDRPGLKGPLADAISEAAVVVHAGDFTTEAVHSGFQSVSRRLRAVYGNRDSQELKHRLPAARTIEFAGVRIALTHTQAGGELGLRYFGEERDADLVICGHTHRPSVTAADGITLLNPGSHTSPRGSDATYSILSPTEEGLSGAIRTVDGRTDREFVVEGRSRGGRDVPG